MPKVALDISIIAAYIFLNRQEGVIKAYSLTLSIIWQYFMTWGNEPEDIVDYAKLFNSFYELDINVMGILLLILRLISLRILAGFVQELSHEDI